MKKTLILAVLSVLILGCIQSQAPENKAVEVANTTVEGKSLFVFREAFSKTSRCTSSEFKQTTQLIGPVLSKVKPELSYPTADSQVDALVANAKACNPDIQIESNPANGTGGSIVKVQYSVSIPESCPVAAVAGKSQSNLVIESNVVDGSAKVISGSLSAEYKNQLETVLPAVGILGNCTAPILLQAGLLNFS